MDEFTVEWAKYLIENYEGHESTPAEVNLVSACREIIRLNEVIEGMKNTIDLCKPILQDDIYDGDNHGCCFYCGADLYAGDHSEGCKQLIAYRACKKWQCPEDIPIVEKWNAGTYRGRPGKCQCPECE